MKTKHKHKQTKQAAPPQRLMVNRTTTAELLDTSTATVRRLEEEGKLHPKRLRSSASAMVFYDYNEVVAVAEEASDA